MLATSTTTLFVCPMLLIAVLYAMIGVRLRVTSSAAARVDIDGPTAVAVIRGRAERRQHRSRSNAIRMLGLCYRRDAMRKRGLCCRPVSVRLSVRHVGELYPHG